MISENIIVGWLSIHLTKTWLLKNNLKKYVVKNMMLKFDTEKIWCYFQNKSAENNNIVSNPKRRFVNKKGKLEEKMYGFINDLTDWM